MNCSWQRNTKKAICFDIVLSTHDNSAIFKSSYINWRLFYFQIVVPTNSTSICTADPNKNLTEVEIMVIEFLLSLLLVWVCCGLWDSRNKNNTDGISIKLGLTVTGLIFSGVSYRIFIIILLKHSSANII